MTSPPPDQQPLTDITVAIPTCNDDPVLLAKLLDAVGRQPLRSPTIVVDMSRGDGVKNVVEARRNRCRYERFSNSSGVSDSRNRLVELVPTRYLLFVDADAVPETGWAHAMRSAFDRDPQAAAIGARCLPDWATSPPRLFRSTPAGHVLSMLDLGDRPMPIPRVIGTSYALDRERLPTPPFPIAIGRRPGSLISGEEVHLSIMVQRMGWTIRYEPAAVVMHHVRPHRLRWRWMLRRMYDAGRESGTWGDQLTPFPMALRAPDYAFKAVTAPWFLAGRWRGLDAEYKAALPPAEPAPR